MRTFRQCVLPGGLFVCDNHNNMSMDIKSDYISPLCKVIEVKTQAVLCQSGGMPEYDWGNGGFKQS